MKRRSISLAVITILVGFFLGAPAFGQQTPNYSGDFWTRSTLTGDWSGVRNDWAAKGVTFDINLTQVGQGDVSGGKKIGWEYGGRGDLKLNVDTQKLGWWPGGFFTVEVEGNFSNSINSFTGALMPVNTNQIFPMPDSDQINVPEVLLTQFLSHYFGVFVGKIDTTSGDMNEFAHGKGDTQFLNLAFGVNPVALLTVPYSSLAAGAIILPTKDPKEATIAIAAMDAEGEADTSGFDTLGKGNTTYSGWGRVRTNFLGKTGHQLVGATYSSMNYASLNKSLRFILENRDIEQENNSWCFYYNFDQYLYEPKKGQGIGIFGRFGVSDGNPNPAHHFYSLGVGGKGVVPGRALDQFGLGWYYIDVATPTFTGPVATRVALRDEQGFEAYYNFAITPWMKLTPDIQVVRGAQKQQVVSVSTAPPSVVKSGVDTATVLGLRLRIVF